jgi:hypothetical protein
LGEWKTQFTGKWEASENTCLTGTEAKVVTPAPAPAPAPAQLVATQQEEVAAQPCRPDDQPPVGSNGKPTKTKRRSTAIETVFPTELQTEEFKAAWASWLDYRKQRRLKDYVPFGIDAQFKRLKKMGVARAVDAINYSMAQDYQGIFEERSGGQSAPKPKRPRIRPIEEERAKWNPTDGGLDDE